MSEKESGVTVTFRASKKVYDRIVEESKKDKRSISNYVALLLEDILFGEEDKEKNVKK